MQKEYGGYLPFEGYVGKDYFSSYGEQNILRTNSGKAAIYHALKMMDITKVYVPYYFCYSVYQMICDTGLDVQRFYIDENLVTMLDEIEDDAGIILVNYFGIMEERVAAIVEKYKNVIVDNTHAFFARPILKENVYNAYSCRKFIGVPDGGYLISQNLKKTEIEAEKISEHFLYLVKSFEHGTNSSYNEKLESDRFFFGNYKGMSDLTRCMLSSVDYEYIKKRRTENLKYLHSRLKQYNKIEIPDLDAPIYLYPLLSEKNIKSELVKNKIYVPTIWRELITDSFLGTREYEMSAGISFLPVDQRYDREDMEYIADKVIKLLEA